MNRYRKGVASIPAEGPTVDEFFLANTGLNFDMCLNYSLDYTTTSEILQNHN